VRQEVDAGRRRPRGARLGFGLGGSLGLLGAVGAVVAAEMRKLELERADLAPDAGVLGLDVVLESKLRRPVFLSTSFSKLEGNKNPTLF
jgi:hypothetical protein